MALQKRNPGYHRQVHRPVACLALVFVISIAGGWLDIASNASGRAIPIGTEAEVVRHVFRFDARALHHKPRTVNLCGTFNDWSHTDTPMTDAGGVYSVALNLAPGLYHYKFLIDGE